MKKLVYISSVLALALAISSCQKDEFDEAFDQAETRTDIQLSSGNPLFDETKAEDGNSERKDVEEDKNVIGFVKEVSDGDDEADTGDDSKTTE